MKDKTLGILNLPKKNQGFPYWELHNHSINFPPPAQRGSQTILTISEYGCRTRSRSHLQKLEGGGYRLANF